MRFFIPTLAAAIAIFSVVSAQPAPEGGADAEAVGAKGGSGLGSKADTAITSTGEDLVAGVTPEEMAQVRAFLRGDTVGS